MISRGDIVSLIDQEAFNDYLRNRFDGDAEKLVQALSESVNRLLHSNLKEAGRFVGVVEGIVRFLPENLQPSLWAVSGRYAHWSGRHEKALGIYKRAVDQCLKLRDARQAATIRQGLMDVYMYLGSYEQALSTGKQALDYFRRKKEQVRSAQIMTNVGNVYHRMDRNRMALRYYDQAHKIFAVRGGVPLGIVDYNRANVYANLNELDTAEKLYRSAAQIYRDNDMELLAAKAEYSLAYLHYLGGKYARALETFDRVHDQFMELGDSRAAAVTNLDLAEIHIALNQFGSAASQGKDALERFHELGHRYEKAKTLFFLAEAARRLGDFEEAGQYLGRAEELFVGEENRLWLGMVGLERTRLHTATGNFEAAITHGIETRRQFVSVGDSRRASDADIAIMEAQIGAGRVAHALSRGRRAQGQNLLASQQQAVYALMGRCFMRKDQPARALKYYRQAIETIETMMGSLFTDEIRFFFALDKYTTYLETVDCLLRLNRVREAFLQHSQALAVLNQRVVPDAAIRREVPAEMLETRTALRAALNRIEWSPGAGQRRLGAEPSQRKLEYRLLAQERRIRSRLGQPTPTKKIRSSRIMEWADTLGRDEVLVNFMSACGEVGVFTVHRGKTTYHRCAADRAELEAAIRQLHFLMEKDVYEPAGSTRSADIIRFYLGELYRMLLGPVALPESATRLVLLVDGIFAQIPFHALLNGSHRRLLEEYEIRLTVNPEDFQHVTNGHFDARRRCAVFAPANAGLPMIAREADNIRRLFPRTHVYGDKTATCERLQKELAACTGFVHIASHASRSSENPLFSRIMMSNGPFFPFDLFSTGVKARLVSLSGCQTAAPGIYYGNAFSLAKAFYQGGVRYVLASLWSVSDKVSMAFMTKFYETLMATSSVSGAYTLAVERTIEVNDNPAFWSPFVLIGL